jgi:hypothetical protein
MRIVSDTIPKKHIESVFNPKGDGNCGFRSLSHELYNDQDQWKNVKQEMLDHMNQNSDFYCYLFTPDNILKSKQILACRDEEVSSSFYFTSPEHPRIACETFKRTIVFLSSQGENITFVPLLSQPIKKQPIFLQLSGMHFYLIKIKQGARCTKYLPRLYPGHQAICQSKMYEDYSLLYY